MAGISVEPPRRSGRCSVERALAPAARAEAELASLRVSRPGALLHMDSEARPLHVPGQRVTGDRSTRTRIRGVATSICTASSTTARRIAYVELHPREDATTNTRTLERALRFFAELGLDPPEAVMTDNALVYRRSRHFRELLHSSGIRHIRTPAYTPRWNGKVERFIQTLQDGLQPHLAKINQLARAA